MSTVTFLSQNLAESLVGPVNMISVVGHGDPEPDFRAEHNLLAMQFDDVEGFIGSGGFKVFSHIEARRIIEFVTSLDGAPLVVHCQAGMSRSAAIAKFCADFMGYKLDLRKPCIGTLDFYNRHVYGTLNMTRADNLKSYYAELELLDRLNGVPNND